MPRFTAVLPLLFLFPCPQGTCFAQIAVAPAEPRGHVLFEKHDEATPAVVTPQAQAPANAVPDISDTERAALTFSAWDLDARITPATARLAMRARTTLRNDGPTPLTHLALQVSSSLVWESVTLVDDATRTKLPIAQHLIETDADHTGKASEAIVTLPKPLGPGGVLTLDTFYSGTISASDTRLARIGASASQAALSDWDAISEHSVALRGFGNVLWYPVAAPQLFLGQGAQLFEAVGQSRLREADARVSLRVTVDYEGAPPIAAYFNGRRQALKGVGGETPDGVPGLVEAVFPASALGFRSMSLFVIPERETIAEPQPGGWSLLAVAARDRTVEEEALPIIAATAKDSGAVLAEWLGPQPLSVLTLVDHDGQAFEDGPLLVASMGALAAPEASAAITHSLTHAWVQSRSPWIEEGLAEFFVLLEVERTRGRDNAIAQLQTLVQPLTLAEIAPEAGKPAASGQPLTAAWSDLYYRRKAAAVWWMLREIVGDEALKIALQAWRSRPAAQLAGQDEALLMESMLERAYGKDLHWFFEDWVLHDRGVPDLQITDVTPRELPPGVAGRPLNQSPGWLVSVTVRNDGAAVADVPVVVRSGTFSTTQRVRVAAFSSAAVRVIVEALPTEVAVNDGVTPEQRTSFHTRTIHVQVR